MERSTHAWSGSPSSYELGSLIGHMDQRLTTTEAAITRLEEAVHWLRRGLLLLAISMAAGFGNFKAETIADILATVIKAGLVR